MSNNTKIVNQKSYIYDMPKGIDAVRQHQKFMADNKHLALEFPIHELRYYFHPTYPGKQTTVQAQSHNGKSLFVDFWATTAARELHAAGQKNGIIIKINTEDAVETLVNSELARGGAGTLDDLQSGIIKNPDQYLQVETEVGRLPVVIIGEGLGMDETVASLLYMSNLIRLIDFARKEYFDEEKRVVAIFVDYIQALTFDPEIKRNGEDTRRIQIISDEDRIRRAAKYFCCPVVSAAQSKQDKDLSTFSGLIKTPGYWDVQESSYVSQHTDFMYSLWFPKSHYPVGSIQEKRDINWTLKVKDNGMWIKSLKHKGYINVGASFPLLVDEYSNMELDRETYNYINKMGSDNGDSDD